MSDLPSNWGMRTPETLLSNLRVAETGGDIAECADALEWMLRSGRLVDREAIDIVKAYQVASMIGINTPADVDRFFDELGLIGDGDE